MTILPVTPDLALAQTGPRSTGLHMSDLYNRLFEELEPKRYIRGSTPDPLRLEAGLAFEEMLEEGLKRRLAGERPGEFTTEDGVAYNPDLILYDPDGRARGGEIKLTWMSTKEMPSQPGDSFPPKFDKYLVQMKAYGYHLGIPRWRLYVFFVNGDYKPPRPVFLAWDLEFTERELQENWDMLRNYAVQKGLLHAVSVSPAHAVRVRPRARGHVARPRSGSTGRPRTPKSRQR